MSRTPSLTRRLCLTAVLLFAALPGSMAGPTAAFAVPVATIHLDPSTPNGSAGWYTSAPEVNLLSDSDGVAHWWWDSGPETTATVTAWVPRYAGDAPEGYSRFSAYVEDLGGPSEVTSIAIKVDQTPPSMPTSLTAIAGSSFVTVAWGSSSDAMSGVAGYDVYRNTTGLPMGPADLVSTVTTATYIDVSPPVSGTIYYAVIAVDAAGWESIRTASVKAVPDLIPPSDLAAWLNASGWSRVSWAPAVDRGSGLAEYVLYRSLDGAPMSSIATLDAGAVHFDDHDAAVPLATTVDYQLVAFDRAGFATPVVGPVRMGQDVTPPRAPVDLRLLPVYAGAIVDAQFDVTWTLVPDEDSGIHKTYLAHGPVSGVPAFEVDAGARSSARISAAMPTALWYVQLRTFDRAGNMSAWTVPAAGRNVAIERLAGATRVETALAISAAAFDSAATVVVASADSFPDALAASGLAGSVNAPIILVRAGSLPRRTIDELARLGAVNAYVVGGRAAVSEATAVSLAGALPGVVRRLGAADRYGTAAMVADEIHARVGNAVIPRVYVVSGTGFADALSASPAAFAEKAPVLFANSASVPAITRSAISRVGATSTVVLGGKRAVTSAAESVLPSVTRVAGVDRYATSALFARWAVSEGVLGGSSPVVATGRAFPDGLAAGPLAGSRTSPLLLTGDPASRPALSFVAAARASLDRQTIVGGTAAVPAPVMRAFWSSVSIP